MLRTVISFCSNRQLPIAPADVDIRGGVQFLALKSSLPIHRMSAAESADCSLAINQSLCLTKSVRFASAVAHCASLPDIPQLPDSAQSPKLENRSLADQHFPVPEDPVGLVNWKTATLWTNCCHDGYEPSTSASRTKFRACLAM